MTRHPLEAVRWSRSVDVYGWGLTEQLREGGGVTLAYLSDLHVIEVGYAGAVTWVPVSLVTVMQPSTTPVEASVPRSVPTAAAGRKAATAAGKP